uniref:Myocilin n=1 Tax=Anas platyrhynchos TaxID=8839 RepID=A0A8B9R2B4_ANAPL
MMPGGRCTYTFTVASPGEASCPEAGGVAQLRAELAGLAARLSRLEGSGGFGGSGPRGAEVGGAWTRGPQRAAAGGCEELLRDKERLEEDKRRLEREKEELSRRLESSTQEIARLRAARCPPGTGGPGRDTLRGSSKGKCRGWNPPGHPIPSPSPATPNSHPDILPELAWVGAPVVLGRADSIPVAPFTRETTWRVDTVGTEQLAQGYPAKVHVLPRPLESTGAVVYRGGLFFQPRRSRALARYDLRAEAISAERELPGAGYHGQYPYSWGGLHRHRPGGGRDGAVGGVQHR